MRGAVHSHADLLEKLARQRLRLELLGKENADLRAKLELVKGLGRRQELDELFALFEKLNRDNQRLSREKAALAERLDSLDSDQGGRQERALKLSGKVQALQERENALLSRIAELEQEIEKMRSAAARLREKAAGAKENARRQPRRSEQKKAPSSKSKPKGDLSKRGNKRARAAERPVKESEAVADELFLKACRLKEELSTKDKAIGKLEREKRLLKELLKSKGVDVDSDLFTKLGVLRGEDRRTERLKRLSKKFRQFF